MVDTTEPINLGSKLPLSRLREHARAAQLIEIGINEASCLVSFRHEIGSKINVFYAPPVVTGVQAKPNVRREVGEDMLQSIFSDPAAHKGKGYYSVSTPVLQSGPVERKLRMKVSGGKLADLAAIDDKEVGRILAIAVFDGFVYSRSSNDETRASLVPEGLTKVLEEATSKDNVDDPSAIIVDSIASGSNGRSFIRFANGTVRLAGDLDVVFAELATKHGAHGPLGVAFGAGPESWSLVTPDGRVFLGPDVEPSLKANIEHADRPRVEAITMGPGNEYWVRFADGTSFPEIRDGEVGEFLEWVKENQGMARMVLWGKEADEWMVLYVQ